MPKIVLPPDVFNIDQAIQALKIKAKYNARAEKLVEYIHQKQENWKVYNEVKQRHLYDYLEQFYRDKLKWPKSMNLKKALKEWGEIYHDCETDHEKLFKKFLL